MSASELEGGVDKRLDISLLLPQVNSEMSAHAGSRCVLRSPGFDVQKDFCKVMDGRIWICIK